MSGGAYDYFYHKVEEVADKIEEESKILKDELKSLSQDEFDHRLKFTVLLRKVAKALKAIEWNDSGDGDPDEWKLINDCLNF